MFTFTNQTCVIGIEIAPTGEVGVSAYPHSIWLGAVGLGCPSSDDLRRQESWTLVLCIFGYMLNKGTPGEQ